MPSITSTGDGFYRRRTFRQSSKLSWHELSRKGWASDTLVNHNTIGHVIVWDPQMKRFNWQNNISTNAPMKGSSALAICQWKDHFSRTSLFCPPTLSPKSGWLDSLKNGGWYGKSWSITQRLTETNSRYNTHKWQQHHFAYSAKPSIGV